jgi:hypothetical protein
MDSDLKTTGGKEMRCMKRIGPRVIFLLLLLWGASGLARAEETPVASGEPAPLEQKTFTRWPDPVVVDCGMFSSLIGMKVEFLRVAAFSGGSLKPIPFQVDERDGKGLRVYPSGERANPEDANGRIDKGEELSFMARDCGDRAPESAFPPGLDIREEVELKDPLTGGRGWVYLLYSETHPPPLSDKDYIIYVPKYTCKGEGDCQVIRSEYMEDHYYPMEPYFDISKYENIGFAHRYMSTTPAAGGTGVDYVDRMKGRLTMAFVFGTLKFHADESKVNFYEAAYKDGPIRLIRNIQIIISLPLGIKAPGIAVDLLWYDTIVDVPMVIDIPFNPKYLLSYLELTVGEDHASGAMGMRIYNSNNPEGFVVDGRTSPQETDRWINDRDEWRLMTGSQGTIMNRSFWDDRYLKQMKWVKVNYRDDLSTMDLPEEDPGMIGMISQTNRVEGIKKDRYFSYLEWYWPPSFLFHGPGNTYRLGDEKSYLDIADHPVILKSGTVEMESHYFGQMPVYEQAEQIIEQKRGGDEAPVLPTGK